MALFHSNKIEVKDSPIHGRGVFATSDIQAGEVLEECHFFTISHTQTTANDAGLHQVVFCWPMGNKECHAVVLGYGTIYNHAEDNNATWETDSALRLYRFYATKEIKSGQEILTNYMR
jgi:SET domain-containing protein